MRAGSGRLDAVRCGLLVCLVAVVAGGGFEVFLQFLWPQLAVHFSYNMNKLMSGSRITKTSKIYSR